MLASMSWQEANRRILIFFFVKCEHRAQSLRMQIRMENPYGCDIAEHRVPCVRNCVDSRPDIGCERAEMTNFQFRFKSVVDIFFDMVEVDTARNFGVFSSSIFADHE